MTCQSAFLHKAFPQPILLFAILSACSATVMAQGGAGGAAQIIRTIRLNLRQQRMDRAAEQLEAYLKEAPDAPDAEEIRQMLGKVKKMMAQQKATTKN